MILLNLVFIALLSFKAFGSDEITESQNVFDAFFPHDPSNLSYVTTEESFTLPNGMVNISLCFWMKPSEATQFSVFSYNVYPSQRYGNVLGWYLEPQVLKSWLCIHENCIEMPAPVVRIDQWHHFCVLYDGKKSNVQVIYNGHQVYEAPGKDKDKNRQIPGNGIVVLGQDQDTYGGGFESWQSMRGRISHLNMWDRLLSITEVKRQMECDAPEGNIISWSRTPWIFLNGAKNYSTLICSEVDERPKFNKEDPLIPCLSVTCNAESITDLQKTFNEYKKEAEMNIKELKEDIRRLQNTDKQLLQKLDNLNKWDEKNLYEMILKQTPDRRQVLKEETRQLRKSAEIQKSKCPDQFVQIDDNCYYFSPNILNDWYEALTACREMTSSLLSVDSIKEWNSIQLYLDLNNMDKDTWWTGGTDENSEGNWTWVNTNQSIHLFNWCSGEPNGQKEEKCIHMRKDGGRWCYNDLPCKNPATFFPTKFICEVEPSGKEIDGI